ncbi:anion permease, partial [Anaerostipes caccae]|uniref:anion permease n=1 Tax=Anaerostipes caccae TaxID=105841 RepID=UPI001D06C0D7
DINKQQGTSLGKRLALIGVAVTIIVIAHFLPTPEGLSYAGKMAIALMVSGIVLWVTEPVPMAISGLALMCLMPG